MHRTRPFSREDIFKAREAVKRLEGISYQQIQSMDTELARDVINSYSDLVYEDSEKLNSLSESLIVEKIKEITPEIAEKKTEEEFQILKEMAINLRYACSLKEDAIMNTIQRLASQGNLNAENSPLYAEFLEIKSKIEYKRQYSSRQYNQEETIEQEDVRIPYQESADVEKRHDNVKEPKTKVNFKSKSNKQAFKQSLEEYKKFIETELEKDKLEKAKVYTPYSDANNLVSRLDKKTQKQIISRAKKMKGCYLDLVKGLMPRLKDSGTLEGRLNAGLPVEEGEIYKTKINYIFLNNSYNDCVEDSQDGSMKEIRDRAVDKGVKNLKDIFTSSSVYINQKDGIGCNFTISI